MATVLGVSGRFFDISLNPSDIKSISTAQSDRSSISRTLERIWDTIKDWFCNTHVREAKDHLAKLYDPNASDRDKSAAYFGLKGLVGGAYVDRFKVQPTSFGYEIKIDYGTELPPYAHSIDLCSGDHLAANINKDISDAWVDPDIRCRYQGELVRDIPRSKYLIAGEEIPNMASNRAGPLGKLRSLKTGICSILKATPEQLTALESISYQKILAMMIQSSLDLHGLPMAYDLLQIRGDGESVYDFAKKGDDIELHVSFTSEWMGDKEQVPFLLAPVHDARILVARDGTATVLSAHCGVRPEQ